MSDPAWMRAHLIDDLALQLSAYSAGFIREMDRRKITRLAALLNFPFHWGVQPQTDKTRGAEEGGNAASDLTAQQGQAADLLNHYGQQATLLILDKARDFANQRGKKLLIVLHGSTDLALLSHGGPRQDQEILSHLIAKKFDYFVVNQAFIKDWQDSKSPLDAADYTKRHFVHGVGHLNPKGNHLVAYVLKNKVVDWLSPKPAPYQAPGEKDVTLQGYLRGGVYKSNPPLEY
jgi:hypothetical protein